MIKIDNVDVFGFEGATRGMRNPYMSHEKSDSVHCKDIYPNCLNCPIFKDFEKGHSYCISNVSSNAEKIVIGITDMTLANKLIKAGPEHRKFLRMIHVQCDVLAPRYWWAEMDKYKHVEANSSSTMHLITKRKLTIDDFSYTRLSYDAIKYFMDEINCKIQLYNQVSDRESKDVILRAIKQMLPESYNQLRTIDTNYEVLLNIWQQRRGHRLIEWTEFRSWIESLPYMPEFIGALEK